MDENLICLIIKELKKENQKTISIWNFENEWKNYTIAELEEKIKK